MVGAYQRLERFRLLLHCCDDGRGACPRLPSPAVYASRLSQHPPVPTTHPPQQDVAKCASCGIFFSRHRNEKQRAIGVRNCSHHPQDPVTYSLKPEGTACTGASGSDDRETVPHPFGSAVWPCCNAVGFEHSKFHLLTVKERTALAQEAGAAFATAGANATTGESLTE